VVGPGDLAHGSFLSREQRAVLSIAPRELAGLKPRGLSKFIIANLHRERCVYAAHGNQ
jgi:hypothetical protein